jgi:ubiquinone/menaquinone biosynthesis C-methylase UbiE
MNNWKKHWDEVYETKPLSEVSWYEPVPETSLQLINKLNLPKDAAIIDIGGYTDITVLDISDKAIERAKRRLSNKAEQVKWIVSDILQYKTQQKYDLWHDRATFHFLTNQQDCQTYIARAHKSLKSKGYFLLSTFTTNGPEKCSGLQIQQYSESSLSKLLKKYFTKLGCLVKTHITPFKTMQQFIYCSFQNY